LPDDFVYSLPTVNALLNSISAILLVAGYVMIRRKRVSAHKACMVGAFVVSTLFLVSYVVYHLNVGSVRYTGAGAARAIYLTILATHIVLAAAILPLALVTLFRAWKEQFDRHARIARWTLPIWLYVSVTGVVIYVMLYGILQP